MLLISLFTDLGYFYINLYSTTGDYRSNSLSKYNYFTKNSLLDSFYIINKLFYFFNNSNSYYKACFF